MQEETNTPSNLLPSIVLSGGVVLGIAAGLLALMPSTGVAPIVSAAGAAVAAIILTFIIALRQNVQTDELLKLLRKVEEQTAATQYGATVVQGDALDMPALAEGSTQADMPAYADEVIAALRERDANLNFDDLRWRRKIPIPTMAGHYGWFVESASGGNNERWFVRKAHGLTVRKAMPRDFLEALEKDGDLNPQHIKLDYQQSNHGLAAWYARTYSDYLWKVSRSNRTGDIRVTSVNEDN